MVTASLPVTSDVPSGFERVARLTEIPESGVMAAHTAAGDAICLVRHGGAVYALADRCTHQEFALSEGELLPDGTVQCAWHGARFDCRSGAVRQGPARRSVCTYDVHVVGDAVYVGRKEHR